MNRDASKPHIAIVGAGPIGIEAALAALDAGCPFTLYEASDGPAGHMRSWGHVRLFTPWDMSVSPRMARHLEAHGLPVPDQPECPTGAELVRHVLRPLAGLPGIAQRLEVNARVIDIGRGRLLKHEEIGSARRAAESFRLLVARPDGTERVATADVVLDCTGTYGNPNHTGSGGIPAVGERALGLEIVRAIPDFQADGPAGRGGWAGKRTLVVGAGHSAQTAVRGLAELARQAPGTRVTWAVRNPDAEWQAATDGDPLPERGRLVAAARSLATGSSPAVDCRTGVVVEELHRGLAILRGRDGADERVEIDRVLSLTGSVGDPSIYRQLQVHECYASSAPMKLAAALLGESSADCLDQTAHGAETLRNPEPDFFILGEKSYGRNNTFLMRIGWQQVSDTFEMLK